jgi:hypothetical protein
MIKSVRVRFWILAILFFPLAKGIGQLDPRDDPSYHPPLPRISWDTLQAKFRYPDVMNRLTKQAAFNVYFFIDSTGSIIKDTVRGFNEADSFRGTDSVFITMVRDTLRAVRWSPATLGGRPIRSWVRIPVLFLLHQTHVMPLLKIETDYIKSQRVE